MPLSGDFRQATVSGHFDLGGAHFPVKFSGGGFTRHGVYYQTTPILFYFDHVLTAYLAAEAQIVGGGSNIRVNVTLQRKGGQTQVFHGPWTFVPGISVSGTLNPAAIYGITNPAVSWSETYHLNEYQDGGVPYEMRHVITWDASFNSTFLVDVYVGFFGPPTTVTCTCSGSMHYEDPGGFEQLVSTGYGYGHHCQWTALGTDPTSFSISWPDASLNSLYPGSIAASDHNAQLTGGVDSASARITAAPYFSSNVAPGGWEWLITSDSFFGGFPPFADLRVLPSWEAQINVDARDYWTAGAVDATCLYTYQPTGGFATLQQTFSSLTGKVIPGSGLAHSVYSFCSDGVVPYGDFTPTVHGYARWSDGSTVAGPGSYAGTTTVDHYQPLGKPDGLDPVAYSWLNPVGGTTTVQLDPTWCDAIGLYPPSANFATYSLPHPEWLRMEASKWFVEATLNFESTHHFTHLDSTSLWHIQNDVAFLAANPAYTGNVTLAILSGQLSVLVNDAGKKAMVYTYLVGEGANPKPLKPFAFRHFRFSAQSPDAGTKFRIGIATRFASGHYWAPTYAWEFTIAAANTPQDCDFDLALPDFASQIDGFGVLTWAANTQVVDPATWYPAGAALWVEVEDGGAGEFNVKLGPLNGIRPDYHTDPILWLVPEGKGDTAGAVETFEQAGTGFPLLARVVIDGARVLEEGVFDDITAGVETLLQFWSSIFARIDSAANDTGVTVVLGPSDWNSAPYTQNTEITQHLFAGRPGLAPIPDTNLIVQGKYRSATISGYYGMGDPAVVGYSSTVVWSFREPLGGERAGTIGGVIPSQQGNVSLQLFDNDTEILSGTAFVYENGLYRLPTKYGVVTPYSNVSGLPEWTGSPPVYTAIGKRLNAYWMKMLGIDPTASGFLVDSSGYLGFHDAFGGPDHRQDWAILDRFPAWFNWRWTPTAVISGVDVAATLEFLHRSYQVGTSVYVGTSRDQGLTWPPVLLTSSAWLNGTPTLAVDRWGNLYCWWDTDSTAFCSLSEDWGQTWATWASLLGLRHVRAIVGLEWHLAIGYDSVGGRLLLYGSRDYFQTWQGPLASVPVAVAQVAGLGLDRHGYYHVVYQEADLLHAYSQDPMVADGLETLLAAAGMPASTFGAPGSVATTGALVAFWTGGGVLQVQPTGPGYLGLVEAAVGPGLGVGLQVVGLTLDHHENGWLVGQTGGGGLNTRWTNDWGRTWEDP